MSKTFGAFLLAVLSIAPAGAAELTVTFGGMFYEGPPRYEILVDGVAITTGTVASEHGDVVRTEVGDPNTLAIRFTNDFAGPMGPDGTRPKGTDRNLIIEAVEFRGEKLLGKQLAGARGVSKSGNFAIVATKQTVDIPIPAPAPPSAPSTIDVASIAASPLHCPSLDVHLTGYEDGQLLPNADVLATLDDLVSSSGCSVIITGYSSTPGSAEGNQRASSLRAQAALDYLVKKGAVFAHVDIAGWGETELFGPSEADNRRVVVSLR